MSSSIRVRFAPSPTGYMHLGNVRAALLNFLYARQHHGVFILRIEDTDEQRNLDDARHALMRDLAWLGLAYDEGPDKGGEYGPYLQSERHAIYEDHLQHLIKQQKVYRCFCTAEELEAQRERQRNAHLPPRYDRSCLHAGPETMQRYEEEKRPFLWRFHVDQTEQVAIYDMARGTITFDMAHFSDFALTRPDGSFTFIFTNFIDDLLMKISHIIRGEDHLTNTAMQAVLFSAFAAPLPVYWHQPILCNKEGKKLSKRDFGFALHDLRTVGYVPEAIVNYLALIGRSVLDEIQSLDQLVQSFDFTHVHATGQIRYDEDKLSWINHKWLGKIALPDLVERVKPFLAAAYPEKEIPADEVLARMLHAIRTEMKLLGDAVSLLSFYFVPPHVEKSAIIQHVGAASAHEVLNLIAQVVHNENSSQAFIDRLKVEAKGRGIPLKDVFEVVRYIWTGSFKGMGMHDLAGFFAYAECVRRIVQVCGDA